MPARKDYLHVETPLIRDQIMSPVKYDHKLGTRVIGIDPGLNKTGYAIIERHVKGPRLLECGLIRTPRNGSVAERVYEIGDSVRDAISEYKPHILAIEQAFVLPKNPKSSLLMSHVRGAVLFVALDQKVPVIHYSATRVKRTLTGGGHASKEDIQQAVMRELNIDLTASPSDVADAVAIALCHYHAPVIDQLLDEMHPQAS
jgi:crossover junction endodeoxyribonuclease RuvC